VRPVSDPERIVPNRQVGCRSKWDQVRYAAVCLARHRGGDLESAGISAAQIEPMGGF